MKIPMSICLIVLLVLALQPASGHISTGEWKNPNALTYVGLGTVTLYMIIEPPVVKDLNAIPFAIPDDTDNNPTCSGTICSEVTILNLSAADASGVAGVRINLSAIGKSPVQPMTLIAGDSFSGTWSAITNASAGKAGLHNLQVNATDVKGNSNTSVNIILRVALNGDANNDGYKTLADVSYFAKAVLNKPGFVLTYPGVGDVNGDCTITLADASFLAKNVLGKPGFSPLK